MGMRRIDPAESGEKLPALQLQVERKIGRLQKGFLHFDIGIVVVVEFENDVGEAFEIRVDRAIKRQLDVAGVETALLRVVIAYLETIEMFVARVSPGKHRVEGDVHVILAPTDRDRRD